MSDWQLAQLNIAQLKAPIDSPELADFVANLNRINTLAEHSAGFVWRLIDDVSSGEAIDQPFGDDMIVNMSVWESVESLHDYVYKTAHAEIMSRRREWFNRVQSVTAVLWWVPAGHQPDLNEAHQRLSMIREEGPGPNAFTFKRIQDKPLS